MSKKAPPSNKRLPRISAALVARKTRVNTVRKIKKKKRNKRPVNKNQIPARAHETTKKYHRIPPQGKPEIFRQFLKYYEWCCCEITRTNQFIIC